MRPFFLLSKHITIVVYCCMKAFILSPNQLCAMRTGPGSTDYTTFEFTFDVFDLSICIGRARAFHMCISASRIPRTVSRVAAHIFFGRLPFAVHTPTVAYELVEQNHYVMVARIAVDVFFSGVLLCAAVVGEYVTAVCVSVFSVFLPIYSSPWYAGLEAQSFPRATCVAAYFSGASDQVPIPKTYGQIGTTLLSRNWAWKWLPVECPNRLA